GQARACALLPWGRGLRLDPSQVTGRASTGAALPCRILAWQGWAIPAGSAMAVEASGTKSTHRCEFHAKTRAKPAFSARSRSAIVTGRPRSTRLVTPCSRIPQGTMPSKWLRSGSTLIAIPWKLIQRRSLTPMAAILSSRGAPSAAAGPAAHTPRPDLALHVELREGGDDPVLELAHIGADVAAAAVEVEHDIGHALAGPVIGVLAAAARRVDREAARIGQVLCPGGGPGGVERRMLEQPDHLVRLAGGDCGHPRFHEGQHLLIGHEALARPPFHHATSGPFTPRGQEFPTGGSGCPGALSPH